jgi:hypothetical protein
MVVLVFPLLDMDRQAMISKLKQRLQRAIRGNIHLPILPPHDHLPMIKVVKANAYSMLV